MKKFFLVLVVVLLAVTTVFANATKETSVAKFDISNCCAEGTAQAAGNDKLAELLNASGLFEVKNYNNSQLGNVVDVLDRVIDGDMIVEMVSPADIADPLQVPDLSASMAPFLFTEYSDIDKLTSSDWFKGLCDKAYEKGVKVLCPNIVNGDRCFVTIDQVKTPADMKGKKLRVPANTNYINIFTAFGASPAPMAVTEVYTALQQKVIDGLEFPIPNVITNGYYEVAKQIANQSYFTEINMWACSTVLWESLSKAQQDKLVECCFAASAFERAEYSKAQAAAKDELIKLGATFYDVDIAAYQKAADKYWELSTFSAGTKEAVYKALGR